MPNLSSAINSLKILKEIVDNNEPINRNSGKLEQADLEKENSVSFDSAIGILEKIQNCNNESLLNGLIKDYNELVKTQTKKKDDLWYFEKDGDEWIKVGQIVMLRFHDLSGNIDEAFIDFPAIIVSITKGTFLEPPTAKVAFANRWNSGEVGGWMYIDDMCVWRYYSPNKEIPKDFLDRLSEMDVGLSGHDLFYIREISDTKREMVYPLLDNKKVELKVKENKVSNLFGIVKNCTEMYGNALGGDVRNHRGSSRSSDKTIKRYIPQSFTDEQDKLLSKFDITVVSKNQDKAGSDIEYVLSGDKSELIKYLKADGINSTDMKDWYGF